MCPRGGGGGGGGAGRGGGGGEMGEGEREETESHEIRMNHAASAWGEFHFVTASAGLAS